MPSYISKRGVWSPAKERAVNQKTGDLYEGPDREALRELKENGGQMGTDALKDPENIMRARQLGMSVEEFLKIHEPPTPEQLKKEEEKENAVVTHKDPDKKAGVQTGSGGFGSPPGSLGG